MRKTAKPCHTVRIYYFVFCDSFRLAMKKIVILLFLGFHAFAQDDKLQYPHAEAGSVSDNYFGTTVADPYRWLENDTLAQTREWITAETSLSEKYLGRLEKKYRMETQLQRNAYFSYAPMVRSGKYFFSYLVIEKDESPYLFLYKHLFDQGSIVVNPQNYITGRGDKVRITGFSLSRDSKNVAFSLSHNGSDWNEIRVTGVFPFRDKEDVLTGVKFSNIEWDSNGFFYCRYPIGNNALKDPTINGALYYHRLGTGQDKDIVLYRDTAYPHALVHFRIIGKGRYLVVYHTRDSLLNVLVKDLLVPGSSFDTLAAGCHGYFNVAGELCHKFVVQTDLNAPRGELLYLSKDKDHHAELLVPQYKEVLEEAKIVGNKIVCTYLKDIDNLILTFDTTGKAVQRVSFPGGSSVEIDHDPANDSITMFHYYSFLHPPIVYEYNVNDFTTHLVKKTIMAFDHHDYVMDKVFYTSKDGTQVPMILAHKKGLKKNGKIPTLLYGYGGYGMVNTPFYSPGFASFMQNGGIVALPCIRGGGEYGRNWHTGGNQANKQNVFDDFISAAEYLFAENYTCKDKLAIMGGSNGGLLVAAVVNQRPDICKAAVAVNGVYDMLRYQQFTIGSAWVSEYGSSSDSTQFGYLYKYSPLHNVRDTMYPAMLVLTGDHDDRVVPLHAYKYVAALQQHNKNSSPILLHVGEHVGHSGGGIDYAKIIYPFIYEQLDVKPNTLYSY